MTNSLARADIVAWRKAERLRLIEQRLAIDAATRRRYAREIMASLTRFIGDLSGRTVSGYWPFRGEPDLRPWMEELAERGGVCVLPVVIEKHAPLIFRTWRKGDKLIAGIWDIPVPADGAEIIPDIVIAPVVGFDAACYRLGNGGGFFDRTLATMSPRPTIIGVGYAEAAISTIHPLPHDIPMQVIVTEQGIITPEPPPAD